MHQPETRPRPSLYYPYEVFAPWLPSRGESEVRPTVVIAGMGPVGLTTALELARHGVPSVLVEPELQVSEGSRAIVFTRRSMEIMQQVGIAHRVAAQGLPWRFGNSYYRGQRVFRMEAPHDEHDRYQPMTNLQQQYIEQYLLERCRQEPLIGLRWGNRVLDVRQDGQGVELDVDTPEGPYRLNCDWLVASDGARSTVRSCLGLQLEGASYEGRFVIADIRIDLPFPTERQAYFDPPWNPGNTVLLHRQPQGIWRVDYQLPVGETPERALAPEALRTRIQAVLAQIGYADRPWELDWSSVYSARTLTLPHYRHGRVLFAGDAAHLLPIFGVRGANTGFQDAQALGWQLGLVAQGLAGAGLLDNYSQERVGAAREIIEEAGKSTRFMTPPSPGFRLLRDAVLSLSLSQAFVRPLYHWRTSRPHEYTASAINAIDDDNARFTEGPAAGAPPRNVCLGQDDFLLDHLGGGFDLLYFSSASRLPDPLLRTLAEWRARGLALRLLVVGAVAPVAGANLTLLDSHGHIRARYGVSTDGAAYLLRPDQHVCARWLQLDASRLHAALGRALALNPHPNL